MIRDRFAVRKQQRRYLKLSVQTFEALSQSVLDIDLLLADSDTSEIYLKMYSRINRKSLQSGYSEGLNGNRSVDLKPLFKDSKVYPYTRYIYNRIC